MSLASELFVRNAIALAGSVVIFYESVSGFEEELEFIWRLPITWVKGIYLVTRYSTLVGSIANLVILFCGPLRFYPNNHDDCQFWFSIFAAMACIPMAAIDAFSVVRIFLLYKQDLRIGILAASLVITELALVTVSSSDALATSPFTPECRITSIPDQMLAFGGWLTGTQLLLIGLTLYKLRSLFDGDTRHGSMVSLVLRQGVLLCFILLVVSVGALLLSLMIGISDPNVVAIWPTVLTSSALCRAILHLRRTALQQTCTVKPDRRTQLDMQFTSWLSSPSEESRVLERDDDNSVLRHRICPGSTPFAAPMASTQPPYGI